MVSMGEEIIFGCGMLVGVLVGFILTALYYEFRRKKGVKNGKRLG